MFFNRKVDAVRATDWRAWVDEHAAIVLDVREPDEWRQGTLPGATTIQLGRLPQELDRLDPDRAVLVICRTGARSGRAAGFLADRGHPRIGNLVGGLRALGMA